MINSRSLASLTDMTKYNNRLRTFIEWPLSFITPKEMAKAGFYYLGKQDLVRCIFCSLNLAFWLRGEQPREKHKQNSPECSFIKNSESICSFYGGNMPIDLSANIDNDQVQLFILTTGIAHKMNIAIHPQYNSLRSRLDTFTVWNNNEKPAINALCEAGFFFRGDDDGVTCFCCGQSLNCWEKEDEPWTEHARWSSTCCFLLLSKGKKFVSIAAGFEHFVSEGTQKILFQLIDIDRDALVDMAMPRSASPTSVIIREIEGLKFVSEDDAASVATVPVSRAVLVERALCKICFKEKLTVVFLPCGHLLACVRCAVTLEHCAVCRQPRYLAMSVLINMDEMIEHFIGNMLLCTTTPVEAIQRGLNVPLDLMLCKVCQEVDLGSVFIPCKHVYACSNCAKTIDVCPVCSTDIYTSMKIYT